MTLNEKIADLAKQALLTDSQFLLDVVSSRHAPRKITVVLDGDQGVTIDDCANVSRRLLPLLEQPGLLEDAFTLEVTTPGLDHPLKHKRQYRKNIGRRIKVQRKDKTIESGKLIDVQEEFIALEEAVKEGKRMTTKETSVPFADIEKATIQVSFK